MLDAAQESRQSFRAHLDRQRKLGVDAVGGLGALLWCHCDNSVLSPVSLTFADLNADVKRKVKFAKFWQVFGKAVGLRQAADSGPC